MQYRTSRANRRRRIGRIFSSSPTKIYIFSWLFKIILFGLIIFIIAVPILFFWYGRDLPTPGKLVQTKYEDATRIYDRNGVLLYSLYQDQDRVYTPINQIPKNLQDATIAVEDKTFYTDTGFSIIGMARAVRNMMLGGGLQSGSTITQQLVKNVLLTNQQTISRKIKELILSIQVDQTYTKPQILEMYLNNIPYGGTAVGVEAASEQYFGENVNQLDLAQCAFLAGLPQSPTLYSPFSGNTYYLARTQEVLGAMVANDYITQSQATNSYNEIKNYTFTQKDTTIKAPHFVMYIKSLLAQQFGEQSVDSGGLQVTTTLDYNIESAAENIVKTQIAGLKSYHVTNGAAVVTDPKTGEILAMVGSENYFDTANDGNFNDALALRQPGSSLKPITYAVAFEHGYTPASMVMDVQTDFKATASDPDYIPVDYSGNFIGPIQLRFALGNSLNIPAVKMLARVGIKNVMQQAYSMGIENWSPTPQNIANVGLSLVLGGRETTLLDETTAYGVFANEGIRQDPVAILKVTDSHGNVLYQHQNTPGPRVLPADISFLISHILADNNARAMEFGPDSWLVVPGKTVSVKTGTTDDKRDNWAVGYTPSYVVGVWVGNNDNSPMNQAISSGETGASPIWEAIMADVLKGQPDQQESIPSDIVAEQVDAFAGGLPYPGQPVRSEYFIKGTQPTAVSPIYRSQNGKNYIVIHEDDPVSADGVNRWQQGIDAWIQQNHKGDPLWNPPPSVIAQVLGTQPTPTPNGTPTPTPTPAP